MRQNSGICRSTEPCVRPLVVLPPQKGPAEHRRMMRDDGRAEGEMKDTNGKNRNQDKNQPIRRVKLGTTETSIDLAVYSALPWLSILHFQQPCVSMSEIQYLEALHFKIKVLKRICNTQELKLRH